MSYVKEVRELQAKTYQYFVDWFKNESKNGHVSFQRVKNAANTFGISYNTDESLAQWLDMLVEKMQVEAMRKNHDL